MNLYREDFNSLDEFMDHEAHTNFADESADNVWNEGK
jgi:hypothetical protein